MTQKVASPRKITKCIANENVWRCESGSQQTAGMQNPHASSHAAFSFVPRRVENEQRMTAVQHGDANETGLIL